MPTESFNLTAQAIEDLDEIWRFIERGSSAAANRVEAEIVVTCRWPAARPQIGHRRRHITSLPVRFWTVPKFSNYIIVYREETKPLQVIAILHGNRNIDQILRIGSSENSDAS